MIWGREMKTKEAVRLNPNTDLLLQIMDALIDTVQRTTDLEHVYNDTEGTSFTWDEVHDMQQELIDINAQPRVEK
jgi:hypothetical protein